MIEELPIAGVLNANMDFIFRCPFGKRARIHSISLTNLLDVPTLVTIYISDNKTIQRISPSEMWIPAKGFARDSDEHILRANCAILASTNRGQAITYVITGLLEADV